MTRQSSLTTLKRKDSLFAWSQRYTSTCSLPLEDIPSHTQHLTFTCLQPKPAPSAASSSSQPPSTPSRIGASAPAAPQAPAPPAATARAPAAPATPSPAAPVGRSEPAVEGTPFHDPSALLIGSQSETVISQIESMGFARNDIDRAMRAAFFNPDRAIEYLLSVSPLPPPPPAVRLLRRRPH